MELKDDIHAVAVAALNKFAGLQNNQQAATALASGGTVEMAMLDLDSLSILEVGMYIEDHFGIEIYADDLLACATLDDLEACIHGLCQQKGMQPA